jgi:hypothetical protein
MGRVLRRRSAVVLAEVCFFAADLCHLFSYPPPKLLDLDYSEFFHPRLLEKE